MLTIHEAIGGDGASVTTALAVAEGTVYVVVGGATVGELPPGALERVMDRYGRPLADDVASNGPAGATLDVGDGAVLYMLRHRAFYDVIARDFLVLKRPDREPVAELSTAIAAALTHLARAATASTKR